MILYTALPIELILEGSECERKFRQIELDGVKLLVEATGEEEGRIVQVLSSDPNDFLNPSFQPGQTVKFYSCAAVVD
ncbi:MAG: hypothetical protein HPY81_00765 [Firmicutes bacterium]|nr:hypothetical protein [Bacillota bacterium]